MLVFLRETITGTSERQKHEPFEQRAERTRREMKLDRKARRPVT